MRPAWRQFWWQLAALTGLVSLCVTSARGDYWAASAIALVLLLQLPGALPWRRRTGSNRRPQA